MRLNTSIIKTGENMSIQKGDKLPSANFMTMGPDGPEPIDTETLFSGKESSAICCPRCIYTYLFCKAFTGL